MDRKKLLAPMIASESITDFDYGAAREKLDAQHVLLIRGLFKPEDVIAARERIRQKFDPTADRKHDPKDAEAIRNNFQKLVVGGTKGKYSVPRFLRIFYNPMFRDDHLGMREIFQKLTQFRNLLYGLPRDFTLHGTENGFWTASRINHYPRGGGFMASHVDAATGAVASEAGLNQYLQLLLLLTKKGVDFFEGGAFIELSGERFFIEDDCDIGDIVIYDGRINHGVEDIDPMEPLDMNSFDGRHVAFVTLFKHLDQNKTLKEYETLFEKK